jgi:hypothetical protein
LRILIFFPSQVVLDQYGDLRVEAADTLRHLWDSFDRRDITINLDLIVSLMQIMMTDEPAVKEVGLTLYLYLLERDFAETGNLQRALRTTTDALDALGATTDFDLRWATWYITTLFFSLYSLYVDRLVRVCVNPSRFQQSVQAKFASQPQMAPHIQRFTDSISEVRSVLFPRLLLPKPVHLHCSS